MVVGGLNKSPRVQSRYCTGTRYELGFSLWLVTHLKLNISGKCMYQWNGNSKHYKGIFISDFICDVGRCRPMTEGVKSK